MIKRIYVVTSQVAISSKRLAQRAAIGEAVNTFLDAASQRAAQV